ncbi:MAG: hypothetical protein ACOX6P_06360 [Candidatus Merdivicinus sp.]
MKKTSARVCAIALLLPTIFLSSCGSEDSNALQVTVCNSYVDETLLDQYESDMLASNPSWTEEGSVVEFTSMNLGTEAADPAAYGASIMKISAMVAAKELDVMICDLENAARNARSGMYATLDEIFTEEELEPFADQFLTFDMVDDDGNPTGEQTPVCGISLSNDALSGIYGESEYGLFIVGNTENLDLAKDVFLQIANS